jgi:hypothetical protein
VSASQTADLGHKICPLCLVEFKGREFGTHCPGCRTDGGPGDGQRVALMPMAVYLANVDFAFVEEFWRDNHKASHELKKRVLDRLEFLRTRQQREFGAGLNQPLTRTPNDPRIKILN